MTASEDLGLDTTELANAIGVDAAEIIQIRENSSLDPESKQGEIALHLIRISRDLHALTNGDKDWIQAFMRSENRGTGGVPVKQIASVDGLMKVVRYIDAMQESNGTGQVFGSS
ncbi:MbcA/ParS/Xre antitoxin family protein [uncultured Methylophaga sp.]|uniref:MbcA/ParS/Xre antitoxin family protein n=1 Tax=uncultured Methylophaga sp. TaxID=285271 RepID=UPI0026227A9B|nr:MbcA/ParS/Xre antitoxin family protein [uncultured Methylophaga sp.]